MYNEIYIWFNIYLLLKLKLNCKIQIKNSLNKLIKIKEYILKKKKNYLCIYIYKIK